MIKQWILQFKIPFGSSGDFITAPKISILFSEIIAIWLISTWERLNKPKNFNIVELGPVTKSMKALCKVFENFSEFNDLKKLYMFEEIKRLEKMQRKVLKNENIKWIKNFDQIKKGPIIFFGNEFFDAIPIKQFKRVKKNLLEKHYILQKNNKIVEFYKNASRKDSNMINSFKTLSNLKFIEFPKFGLTQLEEIINKISKLNGCLLLIDYGYLKPNNLDTLQSVMKHKKNYVLNNLGKADVTSNVNFTLLKEFFLKKNLKVKKIISQREFLINMGIMERAKIIEKNMKFGDKSNLYLRLKRLLSPRLMGDLFKVIITYNFKGKNFYGF